MTKILNIVKKNRERKSYTVTNNL